MRNIVLDKNKTVLKLTQFKKSKKSLYWFINSLWAVDIITLTSIFMKCLRFGPLFLGRNSFWQFALILVFASFRLARSCFWSFSFLRKQFQWRFSKKIWTFYGNDAELQVFRYFLASRSRKRSNLSFDVLSKLLFVKWRHKNLFWVLYKVSDLYQLFVI